ncbi:MAG: hypothetical protein ACTSRC_14775 [Candidatus Helarchaeota archaeon]
MRRTEGIYKDVDKNFMLISILQKIFILSIARKLEGMKNGFGYEIQIQNWHELVFPINSD